MIVAGGGGVELALYRVVPSLIKLSLERFDLKIIIVE
jgi:hypothetical protein